MSATKKKSPAIAGLLGFLFPGLGLFYASPVGLAIGYTVVAIVAFKLLGWIPLLGFVVKLAIVAGSAILGVISANAYNQLGSRPTMKRLSSGR